MVSILRISGIRSVLLIASAISGIWGVFFIASSPIATLNCFSLKFQLDGAAKFNETLTKVLFVVPSNTELLLPHCQDKIFFRFPPYILRRWIKSQLFRLVSFTGSFSTTWQIWRQGDLKMVPLPPLALKDITIHFLLCSFWLPPPHLLSAPNKIQVLLSQSVASRRKDQVIRCYHGAHCRLGTRLTAMLSTFSLFLWEPIFTAFA